MIDLTTSDDFGFWVPFEIVKSKKDKDGKRWIEGIASTSDEDLQQEIVDQRGIDFTYFLKYGYFNNDHKPGFDNKVGEPTEAKITSNGLWVKGFLFKNKKVADNIWEMANSLEASQSTRKLGFSIQGKVLRRAGKRILKCWIQDIAITAAPINTSTWLDVVKSLNAVPTDTWCDDTGCYVVTPEDAYKSLHKGDCTCKGEGCEKCMGDGKPLASSIRETEMDLRKDDDGRESEDKAFAANSDAGRALTPESLEGQVKDQNWGRCGSKEDTKKSITFDESVAWLQAYRNLPRSDALIVAGAVFEMNGIHH